jgi:arylsulfatase A
VGGHMNMIMSSKRHYIPNSPLQYISTSNLPLRDEKGAVYEGGIREPLMVRWPGKIPAGQLSHVLVTTPDFYVTLLELARAPRPSEQVLDGISLVPVLLNQSSDEERAIFWHYPIFHHGFPAAAVRKGDWKLIKSWMDGSLQLFNLRMDLGEQTDLEASFPEKRDELHGLLSQWLEEVGAELPVANPNFDPTRRYEWGTHPDRNKIRGFSVN